MKLAEKYFRIMLSGYNDGSDLSKPEPSSSDHPLYVHSFISGRDDAECTGAAKPFPGRTAAQARAAYEYIVAVLAEE